MINKYMKNIIILSLLSSLLFSCGYYNFETRESEYIASYLEKSEIALDNSYRMNQEQSLPIFSRSATLPNIMYFRSSGCRIPKVVDCMAIANAEIILNAFETDDKYKTVDCDGINSFQNYTDYFLNFETLFKAELQINSENDKVVVFWAAIDEKSFIKNFIELYENLKSIGDNIDVYYVNIDWTPNER